MDALDLGRDDVLSDLVRSVGPAKVGAAISKLVSASIGDLAVVFSRSPTHQHLCLADLKWMVLPPVVAGQFYIVEAADQSTGFRAPVAVVTWAFVSDDLDASLRESTARPQLRPDQWKSGAIGWLIDAAGDAIHLRHAFEWLASEPFRERPLNIVSQDASNTRCVTTLENLLAEQSEMQIKVGR